MFENNSPDWRVEYLSNDLSRLQTLGQQISLLFLLAIPVACISWTFTHEELFREIHDDCLQRSQNCAGFINANFSTH